MSPIRVINTLLLLSAVSGSAQAAQSVKMSSCAGAAPSTCWQYSFTAGVPATSTADSVSYDDVSYYKSGGAIEGSSYIISVTFNLSLENSVSFVVPGAFYGYDAYYFVDSFLLGSVSRPTFLAGDFFGSSAPLGDSNSVRLSTFGAAVPEPATWAILIMGFAAVGIAARRRARGQGIPGTEGIPGTVY